MKNNPRAYTINIHNKLNMALVVCVIYDLGYTGKHRAGDFYQLVITREFLERPAIPTTRQANFCEELRALNTASDIVGGDNELLWVENLMKECYGSSSEIVIKPIENEKKIRE